MIKKRTYKTYISVDVGYLSKRFIISQILSTFLIITTTFTERKTVEHDNSESIDSIKIIKLWRLMFYGSFRRHGIPVNVHI
jgi:hypothetical protein